MFIGPDKERATKESTLLAEVRLSHDISRAYVHLEQDINPSAGRNSYSSASSSHKLDLNLYSSHPLTNTTPFQHSSKMSASLNPDEATLGNGSLHLAETSVLANEPSL